MSEEHTDHFRRPEGWRAEEMRRLPDGSGFAIFSMPLPRDHWIYGDASREDEYGHETSPAPLLMGTKDFINIDVNTDVGMTSQDGLTLKASQWLTRDQFADLIREAARYAVRASTMKGKSDDIDPDAMVQNFVVGMIGYWTEDGQEHL